jgi:BOP1NT (NUC169) domain.
LFTHKFCYRRTVRDPQTGQDVVLSDADVDIIQRLQAQKIPDANFEDAAVSTCNILSTLIVAVTKFTFIVIVEVLTVVNIKTTVF